MPPVVHRRGQCHADVADDLRPHVQSVACGRPVSQTQLRPKFCGDERRRKIAQREPRSRRLSYVAEACSTCRLYRELTEAHGSVPNQNRSIHCDANHLAILQLDWLPCVRRTEMWVVSVPLAVLTVHCPI